MNTLRKYWWHIFLFCVACAVCKIAFELVQVLILEGKGAIDGDGLIFTVM